MRYRSQLSRWAILRCGFNTLTHLQLILFRAIAGIGNGGIKTNVQVIVSDVVSLKERGKVGDLVVLALTVT